MVFQMDIHKIYDLSLISEFDNMAKNKNLYIDYLNFLNNWSSFTFL